MSKEASAGILIWREREPKNFEVLLVHPAGDYNTNAAWSIPKGKFEKEKDTNFVDTAIRETYEETALYFAICELRGLGLVKYRSGKRVYGFAAQYKTGIMREPRLACGGTENDKIEWFSLTYAANKLHYAQSEFVIRLSRILEN